MLNARNKLNKTHEQMMKDVYSEIPIYSEEWTNYNPSDPGITILENLMLFELLQYEQLDETSDKVMQKLLKMVGFEPQKGKCARVLLEAKGLKEAVDLPANQKFRLGDMSFETTKEKRLDPCKLIGVYAGKNGEYKDYSYVLDAEITIGAYVFGKTPQVGSEIYFVMNQVPEPQTETIFYVNTATNQLRNPLGEKDRNRFTKIEWECFTEEGFVPINVKDNSEGFLFDGEMRFRMPAQEAVPYEIGNIKGYVFRGRLTRAQYDMPPKLQHVSGFLLEVWQKDTQAIVYPFAKSNTITIRSELMEEGYYKVLCKEEKGSSYRMYEEAWGESGQGRYFTVTHEEPGVFQIHFNKQKYGYAPARLKQAVKVAVYNRQMMYQYYLGEVLGYDDQEIELPKKNLVTDSFCILAMRYDENGEPIYDFVKPNRMQDEELSYYLFENEGKIRILDAGDFIGAKLYLASIAVSDGEDGNIRENNWFEPTGVLAQAATFRNPANGTGGCFMETLEQTRKRYVQDIYKPYTAVCGKDYEELVQTTPGLCIHKVKAIMDYDRNCVEIAVKPHSLERFPVLSPEYRRILSARVEQCRLLSTRVEILQPVYLAIQVKGTIYVKRHYEHCKEEIEDALREELDYISGDQSFGQVVSFDRIFRKLEMLDCVSHVYDLVLTPQNGQLATRQGADIVPKANCLCYPGTLSLEILTRDTH